MARTKTARTLSRPRTFTCVRPPTVCSSQPCAAQPLADGVAGSPQLPAARRSARLPCLLTVPLIATAGDLARLQALDEGLGCSPCRRRGAPLGIARSARRRLAFGRSVAKVASAPQQARAVLHQRVAKITKTALLPVAFAVGARPCPSSTALLPSASSCGSASPCAPAEAARPARHPRRLSPHGPRPRRVP